MSTEAFSLSIELISGEIFCQYKEQAAPVHFVVSEWRKEGKKYVCYAQQEKSAILYLIRRCSTMQRAQVNTRGGRYPYASARILSKILYFVTNVFVLCLAFNSFVNSTVNMNYGTQTRTKYIIRRHCSALHALLLLPGLYTFNTVCYRVGDFSVKGKLTALRLTKKYAKFRELIKTTG